MGPYHSGEKDPKTAARKEGSPVRTCPTCRVEYHLDVAVCPADGTRLPYAMPVGDGFDTTLITEGQEYGVIRLSGAEDEHMRRSVCPNCGAWKNWEGRGINYICQSCGAHYLYKGDDIFRVIGKMDEQGNLVPEGDLNEKASKLQAELAESPFYKLLTEIDESNKEYWIKKFKKFREGKFNESWNWPSFFFGPLRYFLKGMSTRGALYLFGYLALIAIITGVSGPEDLDSNPLNKVANVLFGVFFAARGSHDYFQFCLKYKDNIKEARRAKLIGKINIVLLVVVWSFLIISSPNLPYPY